MPESSPMMVSAEGRETRARSPLFICTRPLRFNAASASRTEGRPTLKNAISSRSDGNCSPSPNSRRRIICSSSSSTISESFLRASGRLRKLRPIVVVESSACGSNAFIGLIQENALADNNDAIVAQYQSQAKR